MLKGRDYRAVEAQGLWGASTGQEGRGLGFKIEASPDDEGLGFRG